MKLKRLTIISCFAAIGFAFGRWLSPAADALHSEVATNRQAADAVAPETANIPSPERAGRVAFTELYRSLRSASAEDRAAYLRAIQALPSGPERRAALSAFFHSMASVSPQAAVDLVRQVGKDDIQRAAMAVLAVTPAPHTPLLVQMLLDLPADVDQEWRTQQLRGQMPFWAALDPSAAAQFADHYRETDPGLAASGIIGCMAAADPAAAERWLVEHRDLSDNPVVITDYVDGLYSHDPAAARRYLIENASDERVQIAIASIAGRSFLDSADEAASLVKDLPTREARHLALAAISAIDLEAFANDTTSHSSLFAGLAEWLTKFPQEDWAGSLSTLVYKWRHVDPNGPVTWMDKLPSSSRSAVVGEVVEYLPPDDLKQVLSSAHGDFRHDVLTALARRLAAAAEELETLELSPQDAAQLSAIAQQYGYQPSGGEATPRR